MADVLTRHSLPLWEDDRVLVSFDEDEFDEEEWDDEEWEEDEWDEDDWDEDDEEWEDDDWEDEWEEELEDLEDIAARRPRRSEWD